MTNPTPQGMTLREALEEFDGKLESWAGAYPTSVFHEPTDDELAKAHAVLQTVGLTLDVLSASAMRHVATSIAAHFLPVKQALSHPPAPEQASGEPKPDRAFLERTLAAMEGVLDVADRKTDEFDAMRNCVIDLTLMLHKHTQQLLAATPTAEPAGETVPKGWKLAPVEPTDAMVQAAHHLDLSYMPGQEGADRASIYRAMLSASPAAPEAANYERKPWAQNWPPAPEAAKPAGEAVDWLPHDDALRFIQRVLESDAPKADHDDAAKMVRDLRRSFRPLSAPHAAPEAAKHPDEFTCPLCFDDPANIKGAKPEQQAQAGEPEVVAIADGSFNCGAPIGSELITLLSHREAMAEVTRRFEELKRHGVSHHVHNEAIAKKDAALKACVEAMQASTDQTVSTERFFKMISVALTQAEEAMK